jgi:protein-S-isoprenylcysteine O-methyltransferase Ste14
MAPFPIFLAALTILWIAFEAWLVLRDRTKGKGKAAKDKGTLYYNFIALTAGLTLSGFLGHMSAFFFPGGRSYWGLWTGIGIMLIGFAIRIWAVAALGASFRTTVETHKNQTVMQSGPYKLVRHPSYSGLIIMCLGYGIALQNWLSLVLAVLLPILALLYRIHVEELALVASLGEDYAKYQNKTKKLIPWLW